MLMSCYGLRSGHSSILPALKLSNQQLLENQTAYVVTNAIVVSS